jgi:hypothetical protein
MRPLDYKYERTREYRQQEFVKQRGLGVQSVGSHPKAKQIIDQGDGCACSGSDRIDTK